MFLQRYKLSEYCCYYCCYFIVIANLYSGKDKLPCVHEVVDKLFKRREFIPNSLGASLMFAFFAQHFTHQVLKTDFEKGPGYTFGSQVVSA